MFMWNPPANLVGDDDALCAADHCVYSFQVTNPLTGTEFLVTLNTPLLTFLGVGLFFCFVNLVDYALRVKITRYRPRCMFLCYYACLKSFLVVPLFVYLQYWALYDYCWGGAKFIATARSPPSQKKVADEEKGNLSALLFKMRRYRFSVKFIFLFQRRRSRVFVALTCPLAHDMSRSAAKAPPPGPRFLSRSTRNCVFVLF